MRSHELYEIKDDRIERKRKFCPKCTGSFLAEHEDRFACGNCGYTEYKDKE